MKWIDDNRGSVISIMAAIILGIFLGLFVYYKQYPAEAVIGGPGNLGTNSNNKHNLSVNGPGPIKSVSGSTGTTEICIFCHTPHSAIKNAALLNAPLWNHTLSTATYAVKSPGLFINGIGNVNMYSTPLASPDGTSKLCLSCHDGTVAIGSLNSRTVSMSGVTAQGYMPSTAHGFIGNDLRSHHVVSVPMNDALIANSTNACTNGSGATTKLQYPWNGGGTDSVLLRPTTAQYPTGNPGVTRSAGKYTAGYYYGVQCSTCHDPHYWWTDASAGCSNTCNFLVNGACADVKGTGVGCNNINPLCLVCHTTCP